MGRPTKLTKALQNKLIAALKTGATIADVCQHVGIAKSTFHDWIQRGEAGEPIFSEFSEAVTRAQIDAKSTAIKTLKTAMQPYDETSVTTETFTETRMKRDGTEYEYKRVTERKTITSYQGDWRAAVEYLKRRHFAEWGDQSKHINLNVDPTLLQRALDAMEKHGLDPAQVFNDMIAELAHAHEQTVGAADAGEAG